MLEERLGVAVAVALVAKALRLVVGTRDAPHAAGLPPAMTGFGTDLGAVMGQSAKHATVAPICAPKLCPDRGAETDGKGLPGRGAPVKSSLSQPPWGPYM